jgi:hypothetical protein
MHRHAFSLLQQALPTTDAASSPAITCNIWQVIVAETITQACQDRVLMGDNDAWLPTRLHVGR